MKSDLEKGISIGIRFAVSEFLGNLPPQIADDFEDKTTEYLIQEYWEREKEYDKGNV